MKLEKIAKTTGLIIGSSVAIRIGLSYNLGLVTLAGLAGFAYPIATGILRPLADDFINYKK